MSKDEEISNLVEKVFLDAIIIHFQNPEITEITLLILWLLSNLVEENIEFRNRIMSTLIIDIIVEKTYLVLNYDFNTFTEMRVPFLKMSIEFLFRLVDEKNEFPISLLPQLYKIIPIFTNISIFKDDDLFMLCLTGLRSISAIDDPDILAIPKLIMNSNGNFLITLKALDYEGVYKNLLKESLRIIGNLLSVDNTEFIDSILDMDILDFLESILIRIKNKSLLRETVWVVSNICGGHFKHVREVVQSEIFKKIIMLTEDYDYNLKREAIFTIMSICTNDPNFTLSTELLKKGIFKCFSDILENNSDSNVLEMTMNSIESILTTGNVVLNITGENTMSKKFESAGGVAALEKLQSHPINKIYKKAVGILEKFFKTHIGSYNDLIGEYFNGAENNNIIKYNFSVPNDIENISNSNTNNFSNNYSNSDMNNIFNFQGTNNMSDNSNHNLNSGNNFFSFHQSLNNENNNDNNIQNNSNNLNNTFEYLNFPGSNANKNN